MSKLKANTKAIIASDIVEMLKETDLIMGDISDNYYSDLILDIQDILSNYIDEQEIEK